MNTDFITFRDIDPAISFQPSRATKFLSYLTAPKTIAGVLGVGAAAISGCSATLCFIVGAAAVSVQTVFTKTISDSNLRSAVFLEAEHLSRLDIQGGLPFVTIPPILKALERINSPQTRVAKNALEGLLNYEHCFDYLGINNRHLLKDLIEKIRTLKPGQMVAISLSNMMVQLPFQMSGHIIIGSIECEKHGQYTLRIHNGGEGLDFHYERKERESGRKLYQTTLEIGEVKFLHLVNFIKAAAALQAFRPGNSTEKLYRLIPKLDGKILPPRTDARFWMRAQIGNSCSGYAIKCFLRGMLPEEDYRTFKCVLLEMSVKELQKGLQEKGWFYTKTKEHQLAYNELRTKLVQYQNYSSEDLIASSSHLTKLTSFVQRKFWGFVFPLNFMTASSLKLGRESYAFRRMGYLPYFKSLGDAFFAIEDTRWNKKLKRVDAIEKFRVVFNEFFHGLDRTGYTEQEQKDLDNCYEILMTKDADEEGCYLDRFFEIIFAKQTKVITDPVAKALSEAVRCLKQKDLIKTRSLLELIYYSLDSISDNPTVQFEELEFILCQMLYMDDAMTLEEIELSAGIVMIFLEFKMTVPDYLRRNIEFYRDMRLDKLFSKSFLSKFSQEYYLDATKKIESFDSETPKSLKQIIGTSQL